MAAFDNKSEEVKIPEFPVSKFQIIDEELRNRSKWFVKLRWFVPFAIIAGTLLALSTGLVINKSNQIITIGFFILIYNSVFFLVNRRILASENEFPAGKYLYNVWGQVGLDYICLFFLIHFTGGTASPLIYFLIFHIIFASILMPPRSCYIFAFLAVLGIVFITIGEFKGWIPINSIVYQQTVINPPEQPVHFTLKLIFFTASIFVTAFSVSSIMSLVKKRISKLMDLTLIISKLNERLNFLFSMISTIGSIRNLKSVLDSVTTDLTMVMQVQATSVKLLSEDGNHLNYKASFGLQERLIAKHQIEVKKSPLNKKVIMGEPFVTGDVSPGEMFQFGEDLAAAKIKSVLFVPMVVQNKVIGILGAYCHQSDRFSIQDVNFFRLAAGLVAFAIDNAMAYEKVESMSQERTWFMMKVAHNLKAPLSAIVSMIDTVRGEYLGKVNEQQEEYLRRMDRRARTMISMISQLLSLVEKRKSAQLKHEPVDLVYIFGRLERTFTEEVKNKNLTLSIVIPPDLPKILGNADMIEQLFENLLSNSIKYTLEKGKVTVEFLVTGENMVRIMVSDTGIGIPKQDCDNVFNEFFRSKNAQEQDELGTGLGLSIVREIAEQHHGKVHLESEEGCGTLVVVELPVF